MNKQPKDNASTKTEAKGLFALCFCDGCYEWCLYNPAANKIYYGRHLCPRNRRAALIVQRLQALLIGTPFQHYDVFFLSAVRGQHCDAGELFKFIASDAPPQPKWWQFWQPRPVHQIERVGFIDPYLAGSISIIDFWSTNVLGVRLNKCDRYKRWLEVWLKDNGIDYRHHFHLPYFIKNFMHRFGVFGDNVWKFS